MNDTKIFYSFHKDFVNISNDLFIPIQVGKALKNSPNLEMIGDSTGLNISSKNPHFCELTAMYWVWKNQKNLKNIGFMHYRRIFDFSDIGRFKFNKSVGIDRYKNIITKVLDPSYKKLIDHYLDKYDIILPKKRFLRVGYLFLNQEDAYKYHHIKQDWDLLIKVIRETYPDYENSIKIFKRKTMFAYNMMITNNKIFNDYMEWLFTLLEKIEGKIILHPHPHQARVFGFMAERLLNLFVYHNRLKILECPLYFVSE